ncbi:tetratricopeptide repeat protein [Deinococcus aerophilus]|uniref:Membrane protein n=1 Tax=Deinococcus aerophilus TaxID=522488 RepID=A0ABQ2GWS5_9DEIO|nr:tetratricopeptide repeat protein [Deinococcus aerophilus]GGM15969.1 membrane protein [Deinococcus aerophilus]
MDFLQPYLPLIFNVLRVLAVVGLVHAIATRQPVFWMFLLGFGALLGSIFGLLGSLAYTFMVLIPSLRGSTRVAGRAVARGVEAFKPLDVRIREVGERLSESDTLQNRADLAALLARAGRRDEAQATLDPLLGGIYADDPVVLLTSAELDLARGNPAEAEARLNAVDLKTSAATRTRALTLLAQAQAMQNKPQADATYRDAMTAATTEEPRARYAAYLIAQGRQAEARQLLEQMEKTERRATGLYRRQEREWFEMAAGLRREVK